MTLSPSIRRTLLVIAVIIFLTLTWLGITGGVGELSEAHTPGQVAQVFNQLAYGVFALLSVVATFWFRRWARWMLAGFAITVTLAGGLASVVWGGTSLAVGVLSAGATLPVALGIAWLLRVGARGLNDRLQSGP
ncbi:MAG: hypothetical protein ABI969_02895 [bacterium]